MEGTQLWKTKLILLQLSVSNATQVFLRDVGFNLSGNLSCEVTTDGPSFKTALVSKRIIVVGKLKTTIWNKQLFNLILNFKLIYSQ